MGRRNGRNREQRILEIAEKLYPEKFNSKYDEDYNKMSSLDANSGIEFKKALEACFPNETNIRDTEELRTRIQSYTEEHSQLITSGKSLVLRSAEKEGILERNGGNPYAHMDVISPGYYGTKGEIRIFAILSGYEH